jgi:Family of unknown function (DUF6134)
LNAADFHCVERGGVTSANDWAAFERHRSTMEALMRPSLLLCLAAIALLTAVMPSRAQEQIYSYDVVHPLYGTIGTFTESIARRGSTTQIDSHLRVAVRILGIVFHREDADHTEIFRGDRLVLLQTTTTTNGTRVDIRGEAQGDHFVVTSPSGVVETSAEVVPSDPWLLKTSGIGTVVSTKTGRLIGTRVTGGEPATVSVQGVTVATRHFMARGEKQQETWLNNRDVPVRFRSIENGTAIDFVLTSPLRDASTAAAPMVPAAKLQPNGDVQAGSSQGP